ncbi:MAG TPA: DUF3618 domain-containing protein [Tepidisphaeraceae bacterium]|jgi:hypothetical protein|nr:DUF3618 domain-containing protein [Tepidisphaeraceae bacterium]
MAYQPNQVNPAGHASSATPPPPYPEGTSAEAIRRDIDRTRADMDETVDALQDRLKPRHLLDDVLDAFRGSGSSSGGSDSFKDVGSKVLDKLKENPVPAALIGAGITWLLMDNGSSSRGRTRADYTPRKWDVPEYSGSYVDARTGQPYTAEYGDDASRRGTGGGASSGPTSTGPGVVDRTKDAVGGAASSVAGKASGAMQSAKDRASSLAETASDWMGSARDSAGSAGGAMGDYASGASDQAYRGYRASKHYVERGIEDYPLAMGAAAMALGMLGGLLLPSTETEDRLMGQRADELKERAKDAGQSVLESGKHVAAATASAAEDEASKQGGDSLVEKVKHVVQDVKHAATESAKREGIDPGSLAQKGQQVAERAKDAARDESKRQKDQTKL